LKVLELRVVVVLVQTFFVKSLNFVVEINNANAKNNKEEDKI
jgi:hypothetical protein